MAARRLAGRFAAIAMEESPESFQEPMATATTTTAATTRRRGGRRVGLDDGRCRLIHAREPGRRYQQESSIHGKFLRLEPDLGSGPGRSGRADSGAYASRAGPARAFYGLTHFAISSRPALSSWSA